MTRPFTCQAITWPFARLAIASIYVYGLIAQMTDKWHITFFFRSSSSGYHKSVYTALSSLRDAESDSFEVALQQARQHTVDNLCHVSMESAHSVNPLLSRLQGLTELEGFAPLILRYENEMFLEHK